MAAASLLSRQLLLAGRGLGIVGLAIFAMIVAREGFPGSLDEESWEKQVQAVTLALAAIGCLAALAWPGAGGAIVLCAGLALAILGTSAVDPGEAWLGAALFGATALTLLAGWGLRSSLRAGSVLLVVTTVGFGAGAYGVASLYGHLFGPLHPESPLRAEPVDIIEWAWAGAVTAGSFAVNARLAGDSDDVRLVVAEDPAFARVVAISPPARANERENHRVVSLAVEGLEPATRYAYAIQSGGRLDLTRSGTIRTFPTGPASFSFAVGADARTGSNGAVFDTIRAHDPLLFLHLGDFHYANVDSNDRERFERAYDRSLRSPAQSALYRSSATVYAWDDHDFGPGNSDRASPAREAAVEIYRRYVPHYELPGDPSGAVYQAFTIGRVRFILTDSRSMRDPPGSSSGPSRSMLGAAQLQWLKEELRAAAGQYALIVWASSSPWIGPAEDSSDEWAGFAAERREIADFLAENGIRNLLMVTADAHMLAIDDGSNADYSAGGDSGFPVLVAAALDRRGSTKGGPYSEGMYPGPGQFGLVEVIDDGGPELTVRLTGRNYLDQVIVEHTFTVPVAR